MAKIKLIANYLAPSLIAIGILVVDIFVSARLRRSHYAQAGGCGSSPSPIVTVMLALAGLSLSASGVIRSFKDHHTWLGAISVLLTLLVIAGGLMALLALDFEICF